MANLNKLTTVFTGLLGMPGYNTTYWDADIADVGDSATLLGEFWSTVAASISNAVTITIQNNYDVIDPATGNVTGAGSVDVDPISGADSTQPLPFASQGLVRLLTGQYVGGRQLRGRMFIPGMGQGNSNGGKVQPATLTLFNGAISTLAESALAIYSPTNHTYKVVSNGNMWDEFAVLRSRRD